MDKAYNIFIFLIVFGLMLYFLPQITKPFGDLNLFSVLGSNKALVSFDGGNSFKNSNFLTLKSFFSDGTGRLFTVKNSKIYVSFDNGRNWQFLNEVEGLGEKRVLETERNGKVSLIEY